MNRSIAIRPAQQASYRELEKRLALLNAAILENVKDDQRLDMIQEAIRNVRDNIVLAAVEGGLREQAAGREPEWGEKEERPASGEGYRPLYVPG